MEKSNKKCCKKCFNYYFYKKKIKNISYTQLYTTTRLCLYKYITYKRIIIYIYINAKIYIYIYECFICMSYTLTLFDVQYRENLVIFGANSMLNLPISNEYNNLYLILFISFDYFLSNDTKSVL